MFAFELVDAAGAGAAQIREDGTIANASPGFVALAGAAVAAVWLICGWKLGQARERMEPTAAGGASVGYQSTN